MNLSDFRDAVSANPGCGLRIEHPGGRLADHFHVTEVGRVTKEFVDCGGVRRSETRCVLQTLVAGDVDHRLDSTKLDRILSLVDQLDLPGDTQVEVEHQERSVSTDAVESVHREQDALVIRLAAKQTTCLAEDACGITFTSFAGPALAVVDKDGCSGSGCC